MKKISNPAAYYSRLQQLAEVNKSGVKESKNRGIGTLIDYRKSVDGTSYGIVKENHHYYIKKAGLKENPDASDFAYIGGMENITEYQYKSLAEADKKRNMMLHVINESATIITNKSKTKVVKEDVVDDKIKSMEHSASKLDGATAAKKQANAAPAPEIPDLADDQPIPDGEEPAEEPVDGAEGGLDAEEPAEAQTDDKEFDDIMSDLAKGTEKINNKELTKPQVESIFNTIVTAIKPGLAQFDVDEREKLAEPVIKAEDVDGASDLENNMPDDEESLDLAEGDEDLESVRTTLKSFNDQRIANGKEGFDVEEMIQKYFTNNTEGVQTENEEENTDEMKCNECGTFGQYAESRGYSKKALVEADNDVKASIISGYINAFNEGKNNGDAKVISVLAKRAIVESLVNDYGHKHYVETQLNPQLKTLNETTYKSRVKLLSEEFEISKTGVEGGNANNLDTEELKKLVSKVGDPEKAKQMLQDLVGTSMNETEMDEIFGLGDKLGAAGDTVKAGYNAVKDKYNQNLKTRQDATAARKAEADRIAAEKAEAERQAKLSGARDVSIQTIQQPAQSLVDEIKALNANRVERGKTELPADSLFRSMANQVKTGSAVDLSKSKKGWTDESKGLPTGTVEVQPNMLQEVEDDDLENELPDDVELGDDMGDDAVETPEDDTLDLGINMEEPEMDAPEMGFAPDSANMGFETPDHSGVSIVDVNVDGNNKTVNIKLNEALKALKATSNALANAKGGSAKPAAVTATNTKGTKQEKTGGVALVNAKGGSAKPAAVTATNTKGTKQEKTDGVALANNKGSAKATAKAIDETALVDAKGSAKASAKPLGETKKPSAGLTKDEKSKTVKDAKAGKDIGKAGKGFEKVADKAAKEYGSKEAGNKVAAAAMWKAKAKSKAKVNESEEKTKNYIRAKLEELAGFRKPMLNESKKSPALKKLDEMITIEYNKSK